SLFVPVHNGMGRSTFLLLDANLKQVATRTIPPVLIEDRCLDLAWTKNGFYGLFAVSNGLIDAKLNAPVAYPFAMDGGVGAPIAPPPDAATQLHSLGEFVP